MSGEEVNMLGEFAIDLVNKSLERVEENKKHEQVEPEEEDDVLDEEDLAVLK